jgi:hypothetical protein
MNSFDFSIYEIDEDEEKKPEEKNYIEPTPEKDFDFSLYEDEPQEEQKPNAVTEGLKKWLGLGKYGAEKARQNRSLVKGLLSGATAGASENIPGFERQEGEEKFGSGEFVGSVLPIGGASKVVGAGLKTLSGGKKLSKGLERLEKVAHAFGTGSLWEAGKQGVNALSGKEVDLIQIPITGAEFAAFERLIAGGGKLAKKWGEIPPGQQAKILEEGIIPQDLPLSQYETAEQMLDYIKKKAGNPRLPPDDGAPPPPGSSPSRGPSGPNGGNPPSSGPLPLPPPVRPQGPIDPRRFSPGGKDLVFKPEPLNLNPEQALKGDVEALFSQEKFRNSTSGGKAQKDLIMNLDEETYRGVRELYENSEALNRPITETHTQLANNLEHLANQFKEIAEPSDTQKRAIKSLENIYESLVERNEEGELIGYKPVSNQTLIKQVQSLRSIIDFDFAHGDAKNIFRPIISEIENSAIRAAEHAGVPEAVEALREAQAGYRTWVTAFDNDYIRPYRDSSNKDFSKLYKQSLDIDNNNVVKNLLEVADPEGRYAKATTRDLVDKHLGKFLEDPKGANIKEFDAALREIEPVISEQQAQQVREKFMQARQHKARPQKVEVKKKPEKPEAPKPTQIEKLMANYAGKPPENIQRSLNSRTGIKQLREIFSEDKIGEQLFDRAVKQKMRSGLREGNITKDFTGDEIGKFLNKEKNHELFSEFIGEEATENLRKAGLEIGKEKMRTQTIKGKVSKIANKYAIYKTVETILNLL